MNSSYFFVLVLIGIGLLFGLPHLLIPRFLDNVSYDALGGGIGPQSAITTEEVYTYVPEVQEILEGRFPIRDTQLVENKLIPSAFSGETLPAVVMASLAKLTGSVENAFTAADFLFPPMAFWLIYQLTKGLKVGRPLSLLTGAAAIITTRLIELVPYPWAVWDYLIRLRGNEDFLFFSRNFHPQLSFLLFGGMMLAVTAAMNTGGWKKVVVAGALVGTQFYTYVFSWTAMVAMLALLAVWQMGRKSWGSVRRIALFSLIGLVISLPYVGELLQFRALPVYQDFFLKNSLPARSFLLVTARYAALLSLAYWVTKKTQTSALTILMATMAATILLPELASLFLGRDPEGKHWIRRLLMPLSFPLAAYTMTQLYRRQRVLRLSRNVISVAAATALLLIFQFGLRVQVAASRRYTTSFHRPEDKKELFDWINQIPDKEDVIGTIDPGLVAQIPAFTDANNAIPMTTRSLATTRESLDRFLTTAAFYQLTEEAVAYLLWSGVISEQDPEEVRTLAGRYPDLQGSWISRTLYFTAADQGKLFWLSRQRREDIVTRYREQFLNQVDPTAIPFRLDYMIVGPTEQTLMSQHILEGRWAKVFENSSYKVYRVVK